jgi:hypothetical protein
MNVQTNANCSVVAFVTGFLSNLLTCCFLYCFIERCVESFYDCTLLQLFYFCIVYTRIHVILLHLYCAFMTNVDNMLLGLVASVIAYNIINVTRVILIILLLPTSTIYAASLLLNTCSVMPPQFGSLIQSDAVLMAGQVIDLSDLFNFSH